MATTYTITRLSDASYDFTINLDAAFAVATTIRWEIHPTQGEFPLALTTPWTGTVAFDTSQTNQLVTAAITRNHKFLRDFEIRLYDVADNANTPLFTSDAQSIAGDSTLPDRSRSLSGGSDQNVIGLGLSDHISSASGGAGDDTFLITRFQYGTVEIRDGSTSEGGKNLVKFDYEVTITGYHEISSDFFGDMAIDSAALTLSTGAVVTIQSPVGSFRYQLGNGAVRTYDEFKSDVGASGTADTFAGTDTNRFTGDYTITAFTDAPTLSGTRREAGVERSLSGASNEDIFTATSDYDLILSGGAGDDVFVISRFQYGTVEIRDGSTSESGKNLVKFDYEVTITGYHEISSDFFGDMAIDSAALTLSTGAVVTIQSPVGSFRYQLGNGAVRTYDEFKSDVGASGTADTFAGTDTNRFNGDYTIPEPTSASILFAELSYAGSISEDGNSLTAIDIDATLDDEATDISYAFVTDATTGATAPTHLGFAIDSDGVISFTGTASTDLNFESIADNPIRLTVRATYDNGDPDIPNPFDDVEVEISVDDLNDELPVLAPATSGQISVNVFEAMPTSFVRTGFKFTVSDADAADTSFAAGDFDVSGDSRFGVEAFGDMWELVLKANTVLDYETPADRNIDLEITVTDGNGNVSIALPVEVITVDQNDVRTEFGDFTWQVGAATGNANEEHIRTIAENINAVGEVELLRIELTDPDTHFSQLRVSGGVTPSGQIFYITRDGDEAVLHMNVATRAEFDYEDETSHTIWFTVDDDPNDNIAPTRSQNFIINVMDVNDNDPELTVTATVTIDEQTGPMGGFDTGIDFSVTDRDDVTYSQGDFEITDRMGNVDDRFQVIFYQADQGGDIYLKEGVTLEYDNGDTIELRLAVTDDQAPTKTITKDFTITLNEVKTVKFTSPDTIARTASDVNFNIDSRHSDHFVKDIVTERTGGAGVSYDITGGADMDLFTIDNLIAQGGTNKLNLEIQHPDFVKKSRYEVQITATNLDTTETDVQMFTLTVSGYPDTPPVVKLPAGTVADYTTPVDVDEDDTDIITFTIEDPDRNYAASDISVVDSSGMADARFTVTWDEANQMGTLQAAGEGIDFDSLDIPFNGAATDPRWTATFIRVTDDPEGSIASGDDVRVVLRVTDVVEPTTINLIDGKEYTTTDTIHTATTELGGTVTYTLGGTDANLFDINSTSGAVTFKADTTLDDDTKATYEIDITATESGTTNIETQSIIFDVHSIAFTTPLNEDFTIFEINIDGLVAGSFTSLGLRKALEYETMGTKPTAAVTGGADMGVFDVVVGTTTSTTGKVNINLLPNGIVKKHQYEVEITITQPTTEETDVRTITLVVIDHRTKDPIAPIPGTAPPPITPDRTEQQAEVEIPDDDPTAVLTPLPETDPYAS